MINIDLIRFSGDTLRFKLDLDKDLYGGTAIFSLKDVNEDTPILIKKQYFNMPSTMTGEFLIKETYDLLGNFIYNLRFIDHNENLETCAYGELNFEAPISVSL